MTLKVDSLFDTGEFTPENQQRLKQEEEKEHIELDPWKVCKKKTLFKPAL